MNRNKEAGVTIIEILAVVVIGFLIVFILYSIVSKSSDTYDKQMSRNKDLNDAAYALKIITKELRKTVDVTINESSCALTVGDNEFRFEDGVLFQNDIVLVHNLQSFKATTGTFTEDEQCNNGITDQISVKLVTHTNQEYAAELALRKGG